MRSIAIYSPDAFRAYGHCYDYVRGLGSALLERGTRVSVCGWDGPLRYASGIESFRIPATATGGSLRADARRRMGVLGDVVWGIRRLQAERPLLAAFKEAVDSGACGVRPVVLYESFEYRSLARHLRRESGGKASLRLGIFHDTNFNRHHRSFAAALYKTWSRRYVRTILHSVDAAFVHGAAMRTNLLRNVDPRGRFAGSVRVLSYGAPPPVPASALDRGAARAKLQLPDGNAVLLAFGTLRTDKRLDVLLDGVARAPRWFLLIAGPEGDVSEAQLLAMIRERGLTDRVAVKIGFVPPEQHATFFAAADVVAALYDESMRHESATAQLARCFRRPVVAGGGPDLLRYVRDTGVGWTIEPLTGCGLGTVLANLDGAALRDPALAERIARTALARSWLATADGLLSAIRELEEG